MSAKQQSNGGEQTKKGAEAATGDDRAAAIARIAYEKWQARGCPDCDDRRDWFEAELEISAGPAATAKTSEGSPSGKRA